MPLSSLRWIACLGLVLLLTTLPARASHIVGGHLGLVYAGNGEYDLSMTMYFDALNANPGVRESDSLVTLAIYERGADRAAGWLDTFQIWRQGWREVPYTSGSCQGSRLQTLEFGYRRRIWLDPARYISPHGYYVVWQRCCRNNVTTNIPLDPNFPPGSFQAQAQTFYLEFPAPYDAAGAPFINSSPVGFQALGGYLCLSQPSRVPFAGTDPDGDSLVYELVTPLAYDSVGFVGVRPLVPSPGPYPPIVWNPGYDSVTQLPGSQPLLIDRRTGELVVTPGELGLFVFAVRVTEYRGGVRLGELRRDFQALVVNCAPNNAPALVLTGPSPTPGGPRLPRHATITLPAPGTPGERCLNVYVTDPDTLSTLTLRVVPLTGLTQPPPLNISQGTVRTPGGPDTLRIRLCLPACIGNDVSGQASLLIIAEDMGCPQTLTDTTWLTILTPPPPRSAWPTVAATPARYALTVRAGQTLRFTMRGEVPNQPTQPVTIEPINLTSDSLRAFPIVCFATTRAGSATTQLTWPVGCAVPPGDYQLRFRARYYRGACTILLHADTAVRVTVLPPDRTAAPAVRIEPTLTEVVPGQVARFTTRGYDADSDAVTVFATNLDTDPLRRFAVRCPPASGLGQAATELTWPVDCAVPPGDYAIALRVTTLASSCAPSGQADTTVVVRVRAAPAVELAVANVFTPDGDGQNDSFTPVPADYCHTTGFRRLRVFDRWGRLRYDTRTVPVSWDGHDAGAGTYYYMVEYADQAAVKGWVELVR